MRLELAGRADRPVVADVGTHVTHGDDAGEPPGDLVQRQAVDVRMKPEESRRVTDIDRDLIVDDLFTEIIITCVI